MTIYFQVQQMDLRISIEQIIPNFSPHPSFNLFIAVLKEIQVETCAKIKSASKGRQVALINRVYIKQ